jgi:hypothetical protein
VIDVSQMRGGQSLVLSGLILRRIFDRNQQEFTEAEPKTIPTIAVVEEAQSVLHEGRSASEPYIAWVKEGRKYDLGALLITQQPGSLPGEILSQGDNWFVFHLLSANDLVSLKRANAHFSDDLLSSLLNEPIPGQGVFWSSVGGKPYPISMRVHSFEQQYAVRDPAYNSPPGTTFAAQLNRQFGKPEAQAVAPDRAVVAPDDLEGSVEPHQDEGIDHLSDMLAICVKALRDDQRYMDQLHGQPGVAWGSLKALFVSVLPESMDDRQQMAYNMVTKVLQEIFGVDGWASHRIEKNGRSVAYVYAKARE